jgi:hypothetical protein
MLSPATCCFCFGAAVMGQLAAQPAANGATGGWPTERIELTDGQTYRGFIESEDSAWVYLAQVRRPNGRPMFVVIRPVDRSRISRIVRLDPAEKEKLRARIVQFRNRAHIEAGRVEAVELALAEKEGNRYHHYRGKLFSLDSTADEHTTRRMVVRVDQMFTAYRQILTPRREPMRPLRLVVLGSQEEYDDLLSRFDLKIDNAACYIREANLIVASSEIARFATALKKIKDQHDRLRDELDELEDQLRPRLKALSQQLRKQGVARREIGRLLGLERIRFERQIEQKQKELKRCDRKNTKKFDEVTRLMFRRLHHEAFHAYLENYVYPHKSHEIPLWLNEGLATMFEQGRLESGTLRVDAPNRAALKCLKRDLAGDDRLSLESIISAEPKAFLPTASGAEAAVAQRYAYCWGLAYYLTFEKGLLHNGSLDRYVKKNGNTRSAQQRFEKLVGMPLSHFEQQWQEYVLKLK